MSGHYEVVDQLLSADLTEASSPTPSQALETASKALPEQCPHASGALRLVRVIRKLKKDKRGGDCKDCEKDKSRSKSLLKKNGDDSPIIGPIDSPSLPPSTSWICLYCCLVHCGRYDKGHAQAHFETNKHLHCLVMNMDNLDFW